MTADIEKTFRQIRVRDHYQYILLLFLGNSIDRIELYVMNLRKRYYIGIFYRFRKQCT